jgi:hypothetical protein
VGFCRCLSQVPRPGGFSLPSRRTRVLDVLRAGREYRDRTVDEALTRLREDD